MSASEEQMEAHRADEEARARAGRERHEAFVRALKEAYDEAYGRVTDAVPPGEHMTIRRRREAEEAGLLAAAQRACRIHAADLLRIECELNAVAIEPDISDEPDEFDKRRGVKARFAVCAAVGAMRRLRARMRGKARP